MTGRLSGLFKKKTEKPVQYERIIASFNEEEDTTKVLMASVHALAKLGLPLEDQIVAMMVLYMELNGLAWGDFWILLSKIVSKIPFVLRIKPQDD